MKLRTSNIEQLAQGRYDVLVIGGGINGAVAAAALSGKGAKVALIEHATLPDSPASNRATSPGAASSTWRALISGWSEIFV